MRLPVTPIAPSQPAVVTKSSRFIFSWSSSYEGYLPNFFLQDYLQYQLRLQREDQHQAVRTAVCWNPSYRRTELLGPLAEPCDLLGPLADPCDPWGPLILSSFCLPACDPLWDGEELGGGRGESGCGGAVYGPCAQQSCRRYRLPRQMEPLVPGEPLVDSWGAPSWPPPPR